MNTHMSVGERLYFLYANRFNFNFNLHFPYQLSVTFVGTRSIYFSVCWLVDDMNLSFRCVFVVGWNDENPIEIIGMKLLFFSSNFISFCCIQFGFCVVPLIESCVLRNMRSNGQIDF